jgi:tetratricopeptide (TPR) repeat protein
MMRAIVFGWLGEFDESERCSERASQFAERNDRPYDRIAANYGRGVVKMMRGDLDEAESALDQALRVSRESEARLFLPPVMCALGNLYSQRGEPSEARDILLRAKDEAEALGHETSKVAVSAYLGTAYSLLGDTQYGLSLARACQAGARQKGYGGIEALAAYAEANILVFQGEPTAQEAIGCLRRTIDIASQLDAGPLQAAARSVLGRLLSVSGRASEAQEELVQAISLFEHSKMTAQLERAKATLSKFSDM